MKRPLAMALGATLALVLPGAATASPASSVELSNFRFQLIDLAPDDGIAPSIDLGAASENRAFAFPTFVAGTSAFGPVLATAGNAHSFLQGSITGDLSAGGGAQALAQVDDVPGYDLLRYAWVSLGDQGLVPQFTLSPHTELVMTGTATITATTTPQPGGAVEWTRGLVQFGLGDTSGDFDSDNFGLIARNTDPSGPDQSAQGDLSVSFTNATDASMQGVFYVEVYSLAAVDPHPSNIPEPGNLSLMLSALGGIAAMVRLRRRARRDRASQ